jgi:hypothetical protein
LKKDLVTGPIRGFLPYKLWSLAAMSMQGIATGPPSVGSRYDAARDAR